LIFYAAAGHLGTESTSRVGYGNTTRGALDCLSRNTASTGIQRGLRGALAVGIGEMCQAVFRARRGNAKAISNLAKFEIDGRGGATSRASRMLVRDASSNNAGVTTEEVFVGCGSKHAGSRDSTFLSMFLVVILISRYLEATSATRVARGGIIELREAARGQKKKFLRFNLPFALSPRRSIRLWARGGAITIRRAHTWIIPLGADGGASTGRGCTYYSIIARGSASRRIFDGSAI